MTDTPSRMFMVLCLLVGVWIAAYWLYQPRGPRITRDDRPPTLEPALALAEPAPTPEPAPRPQPQAQSQSPPPAPAPTRREQRILPPQFDEIVVQRGDTSWEAIAARVYGDRRQWQAISRANPFVTPDRLFPGRTRLRIPRDPANIQGKLVEVDVPVEPPTAAAPAAGNPADPQAPDPENPAPKPAAPTVYVVQPEDTLWSIARQVLGRGERWREILDLNRDVIPDPDRLPPGQKIRIPAPPAPSPGR